RQARAKLERSAPGRWFFSVDPGVAGCKLVATIAGASGRSDPVALGRVVRLPRIESLSADGAAILLRGQDLDVIAKAGWDANAASAPEGLPKPVALSGHAQTLRIPLDPRPDASLLVWLWGESQPRATKASLPPPPPPEPPKPVVP
ncbi:MAG: hypothetical protein ACRD96_24575, partial [Bryobacteraceae bacterium]